MPLHTCPTCDGQGHVAGEPQDAPTSLCRPLGDHIDLDAATLERLIEEEFTVGDARGYTTPRRIFLRCCELTLRRCNELRPQRGGERARIDLGCVRIVAVDALPKEDAVMDKRQIATTRCAGCGQMVAVIYPYAIETHTIGIEDHEVHPSDRPAWARPDEWIRCVDAGLSLVAHGRPSPFAVARYPELLTAGPLRLRFPGIQS